MTPAAAQSAPAAGAPDPPLTAGAELRRSWRVVFAATLGIGCGAGASLYWFGVLVAPLMAEFNWSNSAISGWALILTVSRNLVAPLTGLLADRFGARRVALVSIPLISLGFAGMGLLLDRLWLLYVGAAFIGVADSAWATYTRAVNSWFTAGRGLALGLTFCGAALTTIAGPRLLQAVVDALDWRIGFLAIAGIALVPLPAVALWLKEQREVAPPGESAAVEQGYGVFAVLRLRPFWFLGGGILLYFLYFTGVQFNLMMLLTAGGFSRVDAASSIALLGTFVLVSKLGAGVIFDRLRAPLVIGTLLVLDAIALGLLAAFPGRAALPALALIGFAHGTMIAGIPYCVARYFGLRFFGAISGMNAVLICISAFGPLMFSLLRDLSGSFRASLFVSAALDLGAATLFLLLSLHPFLAGTGRDAPARRA